MTQKGPEAFRTISEVATDLDLPQHVLRFWETRFAQIKPMKRGGGRRYYRPEDVELLRGIRHLLYGEGYTIKGVKRILKERGVRHVMDVWKPASERVIDDAAAPAVQTPQQPQPSAEAAHGASPGVMRASSSQTAGVDPSSVPPAQPIPVHAAPAQISMQDTHPAAAANPAEAVPPPYPAQAAPAGGHAHEHAGTDLFMRGSAAPSDAHAGTAPAGVPQPAPSNAAPPPDNELPQFGALRKVSSSNAAPPAASTAPPVSSAPAMPSQPPEQAASAQFGSGGAIPSGAVSGSSAPIAAPADPSPGPQPAPAAQAAAPAGNGAMPDVLDAQARQKLQAALYELGECRRVLFDALRAVEE